jgi:hypothetical protein
VLEETALGCMGEVTSWMKDEDDERRSFDRSVVAHMAYTFLVYISLIRSLRSVSVRATGSSKAVLFTYPSFTIPRS